MLNNGTAGPVPPTVLAEVLNNNFNHTCTSFSKPCMQTPGIFNGSGGVGAAYTPDPEGHLGQLVYGNVPRNSFRGPHYSDVDVTLFKDIFKKGSTDFQVGAQAYNVLNHPSFGLPGNNASTGNLAEGGSLGVISSDISPPTSPYGSGQSSAVSGRVLVVQGRLVF